MKSFIKSLLIFAVFAAWSMTLIGCSSDDSTAPSSALLPSADEDVAETVLGALATDNGGLTDQLGDLSSLATATASLAPSAASTPGMGTPSYDSTTGNWTVQLMKEQGLQAGQRYARYTRTYMYQYRDRNGEPQKSWLVGSDTARTMVFSIIDGSGYCRTGRYCGNQTRLTAQWTVANVHTDTLVIAGNCQMEGVDTLKSNQAQRALQYQLTLEFANMRCPRNVGEEATQQIQGELAASVLATVTFMNGQAYGETNIERNMTIQMAQGAARISVHGHTYQGDLTTGDIGN